MTLNLAIVASRLDLLPTVLPRLRPLFDHAVVVIDGHGAVDDLRALAVEQHCEWAVHSWRHENARCMNMAFAAIGQGWLYNHDSDEDVTGAELLRSLATQAHEAGWDCVSIPRRHWRDLGRTQEIKSLWPDRQPRLRKWHVRNVWRVHSEIECGARWVPLDLAVPITIEHFKHALQPPEAFLATDAYYRELMERDYADGRQPWEGVWMRPDDL